MRNGNAKPRNKNKAFGIGSYRTYEEWKREEVAELVDGSTEFLPYLWGMETTVRQDA